MTADVMFEIPTVLTADEILDKAFKKASKVDLHGRSKLDTVRESNIAKLKSSSDTISSTMGKYVKAFPSLGKLSPFYAELVDITVGTDQLKKSLGALDWSRGQVAKIAKKAVRDIGSTNNIGEIDEIRRSAYGRISSVVKQVSGELKFLGKARDKMRKFPVVETSLPTIVVAGSPNVGKSQLIGRVSTAKPRVAEYPFTTKEISVGKFEKRYFKYQVIDTPGLLDRPLERRNAIELRAVLALKHLADAIVFMMDPSETCGYPKTEQENLLRDIERQFSGIPIVVVENKADVVRSDTDRLKVCALSGDGVLALVDLLTDLLKEKVRGEMPQAGTSH